jgi:3-methyladenine DNA glycosylase AlkD
VKTSDVVDAVRAALERVADPVAAPKMAAYMKGIAPFLGVSAPTRRAAVKHLGVPTLDVMAEVAIALYGEPQREFAYVANDWLQAVSQKAPEPASGDLIDLISTLAQTTSWWDTVDGLFPSAGNLARRFPACGHRVEQWVAHDDFWMARIAILHQNGFGTSTDLLRLERVCLARSQDREFFIRKAIGWALRDVAWRNPDWVDAFTTRHADTLSPLTIREARKNLEQARLRLQRS